MSKYASRKTHNRLPKYDYSQSNYYFITICTENKLELFGTIINNELTLNDTGKMIEQTLMEIPVYYPAFLLDSFVVMPNHIHAVIILNDDLYVGQARGPVPTDVNISLSGLVKHIKTFTTKKYIDGVKDKDWTPFNKKIWQRSFYDHVIRTDTSLQHIQEYIQNNPATWDQDEYNPGHNEALHSDAVNRAREC